MIRQLPYSCRICATKRVAEYDDDCPIGNLDAWRKLLVCDRCHDYCIARIRIERSIAAACFMLVRAKINDKAEKMAVDIKPLVERLTKKLATVCCDYYRLTNVWDPEFVDQLIARPEKVGVILGVYVNGLRRIANAR